jgi:hypothetical protein
MNLINVLPLFTLVCSMSAFATGQNQWGQTRLISVKPKSIGSDSIDLIG